MSKKKANKFMELTDGKNKLRWIRFNPQVAERYSDFNDYINLWSCDNNVKEYITGKNNKQRLADFLIDMVLVDDGHDEGLFYCFDMKDNLVGVAYVMAPMEHENKTNIEYVIVDPRRTGQGLATRMVKSIADHPDMFTYDRHKGQIAASVEHTNMASKRVFEKAGFDIVIPGEMSDTGVVNGRYDPLSNRNKYARYILNQRKNIEDKDSEMGDE